MTNLTPAQLEQFETTFRYFDRDETNTLSVSEMAAALASLGIVYAVRNSFQQYLTGLSNKPLARTRIWI
jgi:Ca2+-binding EF-hand superfamily protein